MSKYEASCLKRREMNSVDKVQSEDKVQKGYEGKALGARASQLLLDGGNDDAEDEEPEEWEPEEEPEEWEPKEEEPEEWEPEEEEPEEWDPEEEEPEEWDPEEEEPEEWEPEEEEPEEREPQEEPEEWMVEDSEEKQGELAVEEEEEEPEEWPAEETVNDPEDEPEEETHEWSVEEPAEEASKIVSNYRDANTEHPLGDPDDDLSQEWPAEEAAKDPEDEPEEKTHEWLVEEPAEEASKIVLEYSDADTEHLLGDPDDGLSEEYVSKASSESDADTEHPLGDTDDDLSEEYVSKASSESDADTEHPLRYLDDGLSKEYVSKASSESDVNEAEPQSKSVAVSYNEKKRSHNASPDESAVLPVVNQARKKHRQEESPKPSSNIGPSGSANIQSEPGILGIVVHEQAFEPQEHSGSSGKRRHTVSEDVVSHKKRKTKWDDDGSQLKILGPVQLPDYKKESVFGSNNELEIIELKARLITLNCKLQRSELQDDRPENERSPSPEPVYDNHGIRTNTRESRLRMKLIEERQCIISSLIQKNPTFKPPSEDKPSKLYKKLYIPVKEYPGYNFVGPIIGPRGNTQRRMQMETGAKIQVRGKGASRIKQEPVNSSTEDLHVYIEADNQASLDAAVAIVEKLLIPFNNEVHEHKLAQFVELAQLNGNDGGKILNKVCGEEGHKDQICPSVSSTPVTSNTCDGNSHPKASLSTGAFSSGRGLVSTPVLEIKPEANLYVANLPKALDDNWLKELFSPYGKIISVRVIKDHITGFGKGYGFVQFESSDDAAMAVMHMNGYKMYGKILVVRVAGRPPVANACIPSFLPTYPWPATVSPYVQSQSWLYPPQAYYCPNTTGVDSSLVANNEAVGQPPPPGTADSNCERFPSQVPCASPASFPQIPSYSDYCSFQYLPHVATPVPEGLCEQLVDQSLVSEPKRSPCPATDLLCNTPSLCTHRSYGLKCHSYLATALSETPSAVDPIQSSGSKPILSQSLATDLQQQDLFLSEGDPKYETDLKAASCFDTDLPQ